MKQAHVITLMQCNTCHWAANAKTVLFPNKDVITKFATQAHRATGLICVKPLLVIFTDDCLVSNDVMLATVANPNNNGGVEK